MTTNRTIKLALRVYAWALMVAGVLTALLFMAPPKANAYAITVETRTVNNEVQSRYCWEFKDPLGNNRKWCSGWMTSEPS